jgi:hypothetical protein
VAERARHERWEIVMDERHYTKTEMGMMYGLLAGAAIALLLSALTGQAWWLAMTGAGVALGLGIGASLDQRGS